MTHYHFIGIGGTGLSPIARFLLEKGHQVSGSDVHMSPNLQELEKSGVPIFLGHQPHQIEGADVIIRSSAIPDSNVEVQAGMRKGIPVLKRKEILAELTGDKKVIAIAGTHGKTTTTAMTSWCLHSLNLDPSYIIGGISKNLGTNAHAGKGDYFVIEADEYDHMFLGLSPTILVITTIEHDHPDYFPTKEDYFDAFVELVGRIQPKGTLLVYGDHPVSAKLMGISRGDYTKLNYGKSSLCDFQITHVHHQPRGGTGFDLIYTDSMNNENKISVELLLCGEHNALNAGAALAVAHILGLDLQAARQSLQTFTGTNRRFDIRGEAGGVLIIDDYAHHPSEIRATLAAARCHFPDNRIWCVWQPHTYSRTRELADDFANAFGDCDHVIVTDIFAAREKYQNFSSMEIVRLMRHTDARYIGNLNEAAHVLIQNLKAGDILLVLSAGDADQIGRDVMSQLCERNKQQNG